MTCVHLRKLYQLCQDENLRLGSSDLIHIVCDQCGVKETCPSVLVSENEGGDDRQTPDVPAASSSVAPSSPRK